MAAEGQGGAPEGAHYVGVGCLTFVIGFVAGGMIAVLIAKIVGAITGCAPINEEGAPCNWHIYWLVGAILGGIGVPAVSLTRLRRGRARALNSERG
ncbi:MAG TPA: hypothetical protein VJU87_07315 [Gemmatimonadaceae bacterium]|nr:hypothetical protein [Gemmatimonadaceae bacterium]